MKNHSEPLYPRSGDPSVADGPRGHVPPHLFLAAARRQHPRQLRRAEEHRGPEGGLGDQGGRGAVHNAGGTNPRQARARLAQVRRSRRRV